MARPQKLGVDYFPVDVDMDQDDKITLIEAKYGLPGFAVLVKLLMKIYKEGYFYPWTEKEQLLFSKKINVDINLLNEIVNDCLKWNFFELGMYQNYKILTSNGIQKRYIEAVRRRKDICLILEYALIDVNYYQEKYKIYINLVNVNNNKVNVNNGTQSKVKDSKENNTITPGVNVNNNPSLTPGQRAKRHLDYFSIKFKEKFNTDMIVDGGKDMSLLIKLTNKKTDDQVKQYIDIFFASNDKWITNSAYTIGVFFSIINKIMITTQPRADPSNIQIQNYIKAAENYD